MKRVTPKLFFGAVVICIMGLYCIIAPASLDTHSVPLAQCAPNIKVWNNSQSFREDVACAPKVNLMFLKTHKTGSSTLMNILLRFGEKHQLKFALPDSRNDFSYPSSFFRTQVKSYQPGTCYNIVCNHMRFNAPEVKKLLPADTVFFTIIRDPAELFESTFHYFKAYIPQTWRIPGENQLKEFLAHPNRYFNPKGINAFYLKNLQFFDFGFENDLDAGDPRVQRGIEINARNATSVALMSPEMKTQARQWSSADWQLYRHFNATFWARVEAYGRSRMEEHVKELRRRNAEMEAICIDGGRAVEAKDITDRHMKPWQPIGKASILGFNLRTDIDQQYQELCRKMLTPEIQYLTDLGVNLWITRLWGWFKDGIIQFGMSS
ncbi:galactosylceramide sulfotransferase isoform X2 [Pimephales promelas]|uniref:galactosylceramide sulfotransferase isoform X2 n=1 Tax=Pimephales promelas TaxID=90988 RepID=UPI001955C0F6|nr:galactosylceramide sulfotransferase isoform X2 [Pimephales promelas]